MNCSRCGKATVEEAKFCDQCGAPVEESTLIRPGDPQLANVRAVLSDRYRVEGVLGRGGMGDVYRAYDPSLDRFVAIKVIPRERTWDAQFVERFRREARLAAKLRHPHIVNIHEVRAVGGIHYFAMDYVEGETLRSLVERRGGLPPDDAVSIVLEIGKAVAHAHDKGVIHRDLKPENVMVNREGEVFVMDFGMARALQDPTITDSGAVIGTPLYMSPEQLNGEALDERSDIFSLGLIFYYCLTAENLFVASSIPGIVSRQLSTNVQEVIAADPRIPRNFKAPLERMLQRDREHRISSVRQVIEQLIPHPPGPLASRSVVEKPPAAPPHPEKPASEADAVSEAGARRRARLRALLDKF